MPYLRIEKGESAPREIELRHEEFTIGRGTGNDLHLKNPWLSRHHAKILHRSDGYTLLDLGSRNGTFLNGQPIRGETALSSGDLIALGDVQVRFESSAGALKVSDAGGPLSQEGTVMLNSEDLLFSRYHETAPRKLEADGGFDLLPALNAAASELIVHYPLEELVERVLKLVVRPVRAERGALLLRSRTGDGELEIKAVHGYGKDEEVAISRTLIDEVLDNKKAVLTLDAQSDHRFGRADSIMLQGIRSIISVPLWNNREVIGLIYLDHRLSGGVFDEEALRLVGLIGNMAAVKIENAYLLEEYIEKRRMEEQLAVGAQIQKNLLPAGDPEVAGYDVRSLYESCWEIGGDYYDFIPKDDGKISIVIADIAGKGVGAALLMAVLQASLRSLVPSSPEPAALVERLNQALVGNSPYNKFATVFYAELDPRAHTLEYVNGGHNPALVFSSGGVERLDPTGPLVGMLPQAEWSSRRIELEPGAVLLLYTDGITELTGEGEEEFGIGRLEVLLGKRLELGAQGLIDRICERLLEFKAEGPADDDSTMVVVRRLAPGETTAEFRAGTEDLDVPFANSDPSPPLKKGG